MNAPLIHVQHLHLHLAPSPVDLGTLPRSRAANSGAGLRFELSADGAYVIDHKLNLIWAADESEKEYVNADGKKFAEEYRLAGAPGRLPTQDELQSLRDLTRCNPCIDTGVFKCRSGWTWTDTPVPGSSDGVFCVGFNGGGVYNLDRSGKAFVRPVRSVSPGQ